MYPIKIDTSEPDEGIRYFLANKQWVTRQAYGNRLVETIEQMVASAQGIGGSRSGKNAPHHSGQRTVRCHRGPN